MHGYINSELAAGFSYYQKDGDSYQLKTANADQSIIKYTEDTPKVVIDTTYCVSTLGNLFRPWTLDWCKAGSNTSHYTFYVPEGSIKENYNLGE